MGVPAFFRWLTRKYPSVVVQCLEEKPKTDPTTDDKIPVDTSQPNPNGVEFDNLYLDMNGIIHPCTHPEDRPAPKNEDEMMVIIFEFIDRIFSIVRPRKLLYMAIDGVAPRAKMNQQRSRRFRAAKESFEKASEIKRIKEQIISNGGVVPADQPHDEKFDSNCITPGTPFMHKLATCLRYYVHDRLNTDPGWKNVTVILSDASVPGEGEHKIMDYIRRQRANPDHDPNTHHVLCGADADLIMLGLATHEPYFTIIREEFRPDKPRPCEVCNQFGHETKECMGLAREKAGAHDEMANSFTPSEQHYIFLRLSILREYLSKELHMTNLPFKFDIERAIDDWVFMCFFVGNDFLPHLPSLEIRENAIDRLVNLYKTMIQNAGGYLTDCGEVNLERVQYILVGIGEVEDDIFKRRQRNEMEFKKRQNEKKKRTRMGGDMPMEMPEWMKTGPYAPTPLGKKFIEPVKTSNKFDELDADKDEDGKRGVKRKHDLEVVEVIEVTEKKKTVESSQVQDEKLDDVVEKILENAEDIEDDSKDPVRLWEDGWRQRYYKVKFDVSENDEEFRYHVACEYTIGLQWVLKYYYQGVPSWNWYFPYHYAPFASDFARISEAVCGFDKKSEPFRPFEQLMAVFPAASKKHVPAPWQKLMTDINSPIIDFYPEDFQVDLNGKKMAWQGVALLPFVDEQRLMKAIEPLVENLSAEELERNTRGADRLFVSKSHPLYQSIRDLYKDPKKFKNFKHALDMDTSLSSGMAGKIWCDKHTVKEGDIYRSPLRHLCPDLVDNRVASCHYHDPVYADEFVFQTNMLEGAILPEATLKPEDFESNRSYRPNLGFNRNNDYRPNKNPTVANRMLQNSLGSAGAVMSSAYGGHNSVYGAYRTSQYSTSTATDNSQYQRNQTNYQNNNRSYNYNNNQAPNRSFNNANQQQGYNNPAMNSNQRGGGGGGGGGGNNSNYRNNYGNNSNFNQGRNYNYNNNAGQGGNNYGQNRFSDNAPNRAQNQAGYNYNNNPNNNNNNNNNPNNNAQKQYNRQNTR